MTATGIKGRAYGYSGFSTNGRITGAVIAWCRRIIFLLAATGLQACGHAQIARALDPVANIDASKPVALGNGTGMIVGSVTAPRVEHYWEITTFHYRSLDGSETGQVQSASPVSNFLWWKDVAVQPGGMGPDPGLHDQLGRLFAIPLKAGTYEIFRTDIGHFCPPLNPVQFEVKDGEIVYLGNLHMRHCLYAPSDRRAYRSYVSGGIPQVRNDASRDLHLLVQKYPMLKGLHISTSVLDDETWRDLPMPGDSLCP